MSKQIIAYGLVVGGLLFLGWPVPARVRAATTAIVGGSNGASCSSGGYFTPSSVTITSGNTVTFSVPANDPYAAGLQIHGFSEGNFTILPGGSHTTAALSSSVSYYATWPSSGCMKGSGSITVSAPAPPPTPTPTPAPTPAPAPAPTPAASSGNTSSASSQSSTTTKPTNPESTTKTETPATTKTSTDDTSSTTNSHSQTPAAKADKPAEKSPNLVLVSSLATGSIIGLVAILFGIRILLRRRPKATL